MGNSKAKVGVAIQTDKQFYLPGEVVHGCVYINSPKPYPATQILLNISGVEKSWWRENTNIQVKNSQTSVVSNDTLYTSPPGSGRKVMKMNMEGDRSAECKILQASFVLSSWGKEAFLHGQYAFPFEFMFPSFIPGSFREEKPSFKASISYEVKCTVISPKKDFPSVQTVKELIVRENRKTAEQYLYGEVYLYPQTCFCLKKGVSKICCYFEKNQYLPGEECIAICQVDNYKCSTPISRVNVRFLKCVSLMSAFGEEKNFIEQINTISFSGVGAHLMYTGENAQRLALPLKSRNSNTSILPSTSGRYVKCEYHIEVTPVISGCCVRNSDSFTVRLNILQQGLAGEKIEEPENWNPEVYKKSQIILSSRPENPNLNQMNQNYY